MSDKDIIVCRCEDITLADIRQCLDEGYTTFEEIKRILRIGMGPCQGQTCGILVQREIARYMKKSVEEIALPKTRPLTTGVVLADIAGAKDE
ncbi:MAG TPA: (2Fe-2S)-binding protein [Bacillota bacterium]|nr:(2Fe-2S)-binding protein [Bacillota bacterium]HPJ23789.1 (2Fe-2S)-binding protein [Bacillota bacterium]